MKCTRCLGEIDKLNDYQKNLSRDPQYSKEEMMERLEIRFWLEHDVFKKDIEYIYLDREYYIIHIYDAITAEELNKIIKRFKIYKIFGQDATKRYELSIYLERRAK